MSLIKSMKGQSYNKVIKERMNVIMIILKNNYFSISKKVSDKAASTNHGIEETKSGDGALPNKKSVAGSIELPSQAKEEHSYAPNSRLSSLANKTDSIAILNESVKIIRYLASSKKVIELLYDKLVGRLLTF